MSVSKEAIPGAAIEAAGLALRNAAINDQVTAFPISFHERHALAALTAAAPYIQAAALRDAADVLEGGWAYGAELKPDGNEDRAIAAAIQMTHENAEQLRARADQLEGKTK